MGVEGGQSVSPSEGVAGASSHGSGSGDVDGAGTSAAIRGDNGTAGGLDGTEIESSIRGGTLTGSDVGCERSAGCRSTGGSGRTTFVPGLFSIMRDGGVNFRKKRLFLLVRRPEPSTLTQY